MACRDRRHRPARLPFRHLAPGVLMALAAGTATAPAGAAPVHDPAQTQADVLRPAYRSAFGAYRPWQDQAVGDWRALNDRVGRVGGWRTYLKQAQEPEPSETGAKPRPAPAEAPGRTPASAAQPGAHPGSHPGPQHGMHHGTGPAPKETPR